MVVLSDILDMPGNQGTAFDVEFTLVTQQENQTSHIELEGTLVDILNILIPDHAKDVKAKVRGGGAEGIEN